ncbi:CatB-related O-acetyltransferase [Adhaeribacter radiodurans]|uniref:CatB-related O-acetyltransferase n=1 Tax=Adhaeribacter radiodurans TaxID=2745197 RepID=A0A7L7L427_9BACT|nr:CatB-related O-acetyltransferase [Adhaeribacter radiodurans]QMU27568.1 CatB-related O-acetyltransferase [Adhaeribacter radiodurans]
MIKFFKKTFDWFNAKWIGGKIHITSNVQQSVLGANVRISKYSYCYNSQIGSYTYFSGYNLIVNSNIGKFCSIGLFVSICPGKHPTSTFVSTSPVFYSLHKPTFSSFQAFNESGGVEIGHDVWIGSNSIILDDVKIGHGAIVAAGSVVNRDVEPYAIVGGVPAKLIKKRFSDETIDKLLNSKWWEQSDDWLRDNCQSMQNIDKFLRLIQNSN